MTRKQKLIGVCLASLIALAGTAYIFLTPFNRIIGVRIGGTLTSFPAVPASINGLYPGQLKLAGFPPFVINIRYLANNDGFITWTRADGGYWAERVRKNPDGWLRVGDYTYAVSATEKFNDEKLDLIQQMVAGFTDQALESHLDWEVFLWTPR